MVSIEDVIRILTARGAAWAENALTLPADTSSFGYGRAVGTYTGFKMALQAIDEALEEDAQKESEEEELL